MYSETMSSGVFPSQLCLLQRSNKEEQPFSSQIVVINEKNDNTLFSRLPILRKQNYIPIGLSKLYKSFFMIVFGLINFIIL